MAEYSIRPMQKSEAEAYRSLRLQALKTNPEAFGSSYEESIELPLEAFAQRIPEPDSEDLIMVVVAENHLLGMIGFLREKHLKQRHAGFIWGVYLAPEARGKGLGHKMMEQIMTHARKLEGLRKIELAVITTNPPALKLYQAFGFEIWGTQPEALKVDDSFYDQYHMICHLEK